MRPEAVALDVASHRLIVNLGDTGAIGVSDVSAHALLATWPLAGCNELAANMLRGTVLDEVATRARHIQLVRCAVLRVAIDRAYRYKGSRT